MYQIFYRVPKRYTDKFGLDGNDSIVGVSNKFALGDKMMKVAVKGVLEAKRVRAIDGSFQKPVHQGRVREIVRQTDVAVVKES